MTTFFCVRTKSLNLATDEKRQEYDKIAEYNQRSTKQHIKQNFAKNKTFFILRLFCALTHYIALFRTMIINAFLKLIY